MHKNERDIDPSIELVPIDAPGKRPRGFRPLLLFLLIAGAVAISLAALLVIATIIARVGQTRVRNVAVAAPQDAAELRQESARTFSAFDAAETATSILSASEQGDRDAIDALFREIASFATDENHAEFRKLVDADRLMKRIELTGNVPRWTQWNRNIVKMQIVASTEVESYWGELQIAGILTPQDDAGTRVVYIYAREPETDEQTEYRFWIAHDDNRWKIYDWERLDLGLSKSQEWSLYLKYSETPELKGFEIWGGLISETDAQMQKGDNVAAKESLRRAEALPVPKELLGFRGVLTAYRWAALGETSEAERCYLGVERPDDTPGVYFGLMTSKSDSDPRKALHYAQLYEQSVGPTTGSLEVTGRLLKNLGRQAESAAAWKKLLRIRPSDAGALREYFFMLPNEDKSEFTKQLDRLEDPVAAIVSIADYVGYRDYHGLLFIAAYLNRRSPNAAGTHYVNGLVQYLDGKYEEAAQLYRSALEAETSDDQRNNYVEGYIDAMVASGQVAAAFENVPNPQAAVESLLYEYDDGVTQLSEDEYRQLVALYRRQAPTNLDAMQREAQLAAAQDQSEVAERIYREALQQAESQTGDDAEYQRDAIAASLAHALHQRGELRSAYETIGEQRDRFSQLSRLAIHRERWDEVTTLLKWHRAKDPDDPQIYFVSGELAAHDEEWDKAIQLFQQGLNSAADQEKWLLNRRLAEVHVDAGRWLEFFRNSQDQDKLFDTLADHFVADKDWNSLGTLIAERRRQSPWDFRAAKRQAEAAWEQSDDFQFIPAAEKVLNVPGGDLQTYERARIENQLLSALLRINRFDRARRLADLKKQRENDVVPLAIVYAAQDDVDLASRTALAGAKREDSAFRLYSDDYAGKLFLGEQYRDLQRMFPVALPYRTTDKLAVFLLSEELSLKAPAIAAAAAELGSGTEVTLIETPGKSTSHAFAVRVGDASIWLAIGKGKLDDGWEFEEDSSTLATLVSDSNYWLAVGTAGWLERDRIQSEAAARRLASKLVGATPIAICVRGREFWSGFKLYQANPQLIATWSTTGELGSAERGAPIIEKARNHVAANREFDRSLREAARTLESSPEARFRVAAYVCGNPPLDPLQLKVSSIRRAYGGLEFDGILESKSTLIPLLSDGLSMRFSQYEIQEWQLNDDAPVYRP